jgi:prolyl-tRNA synthetase
MDELMKAIKNKKIALTPLCSNLECEDYIKDKTGGAKTLNMPFKQPSLEDKKCVWCGKPASYIVYVAKSY